MPNSSKHNTNWTIVPQGDRSLLLEFETDQIDVDVGRRCAAVAAALRAANISGVTDVVPAFNTVAVHYHPRLFGLSTKFQRVTAEINAVLNDIQTHPVQAGPGREIEIPVCYGGVHGPDLAGVAKHCGLSEAEVIALHSGPLAYVFMLGFAPGAPYIGVHDKRLAIGRRDTPRTALPAGSVAIANLQTMIYPNISPGGWHIIGATPAQLFNPFQEPASLLAPGDAVKFVPITDAEFNVLKQGRS